MHPETIRVLIVDDSAFFRTILASIFRDIPECNVVGQARNGNEAIAQIETLKPSLVTMDVEMPGLDGISTLREIRRRGFDVQVLMLSRLTSKGAKITTDALLEGAFDFVTKPSGQNLAANKRILSQQLRERIPSLLHSTSTDARVPGYSLMQTEIQPLCDFNPSLVVIGSSTGGPDALKRIVPKLAPKTSAPIVVVQHMPEEFTGRLANRLHELSAIAVQEASDGEALSTGSVFIAPGGIHLGFQRVSPKRVSFQFVDAPKEHGCKPSVDFTLRSAVEVFGHQLLVVILTGMGIDGTEGCRLVRKQGGKVITQSASDCVVYGMPKSVVEAGLSQLTLPANEIVALLNETLSPH